MSPFPVIFVLYVLSGHGAYGYGAEPLYQTKQECLAAIETQAHSEPGNGDPPEVRALHFKCVGYQLQR
jgi:hypothetical protein